MDITEKGVDGQVTLTDTAVIIRHFWNSKNGRGTATYPLDTITGVEYRPGVLAAKFTLVVPGTVQRGSKKGDPLTVEVGRNHADGFKKLADEILRKVRRPPLVTVQQQTPPGPVAPDLAGQLAQLGELRARGVLSDAEFAAAKARLLGG